MNHKLKMGCKPATYDARDFCFAKYRTPVPLPPRPKEYGHEKAFPFDGWGMLGNSIAGDCVIAGGCHETMLWTKEGGKPATFSDETALADYAAITGYDPATGANDYGTQVRDALKYRQKIGLIDTNGNRHKIGAYVSLELGNLDHVEEAIYLFGAVGIAFQMTHSAQDQFSAGEPWSVIPGTSNIGGHYVSLVARRRWLLCVTWARLQGMTDRFVGSQMTEAWAIISPERMVNGLSPEHFDMDQLLADLDSL